MKRVKIGGQAVMEGVMMKNGDRYAVAVRKPDQEIEVKVVDYVSIGSKSVFFRIPIIRGVVNFIESLVIGVKTLMYSASFYDEEEDSESTRSVEKQRTQKQQKKSDDLAMYGTVHDVASIYRGTDRTRGGEQSAHVRYRGSDKTCDIHWVCCSYIPYEGYTESVYVSRCGA